MAPDDHSGARPAGPVVLRIKLRYDDLDAMVSRFASNVGKSGLFLPTKSMQPVGAEVKFELRLANDTPVLVGLGRVKHVRPPDPANPRAAFGLAIELMRVTREGREVIIRMIERRRALGLPDVAIPLPEDVDAAKRADLESQPRADTAGIVREAMAQMASAPVSEQILTARQNTGPFAVAKLETAPVPLVKEPVAEPAKVEPVAQEPVAAEPVAAKAALEKASAAATRAKSKSVAPAPSKAEPEPVAAAREPEASKAEPEPVAAAREPEASKAEPEPVAAAREPEASMRPSGRVVRPSSAPFAAPRESGPITRPTVAALAPEPPRARRPRLQELIAKASESGPVVAASGELDEHVDVERALARARALAGGDMDAELANLRESAAAPIEISVEAASAELARQLGGNAISRRDRSARWAPPPASVPMTLLARGTDPENPVVDAPEAFETRAAEPGERHAPAVEPEAVERDEAAVEAAALVIDSAPVVAATVDAAPVVAAAVDAAPVAVGDDDDDAFSESAPGASTSIDPEALRASRRSGDINDFDRSAPGASTTIDPGPQAHRAFAPPNADEIITTPGDDPDAPARSQAGTRPPAMLVDDDADLDAFERALDGAIIRTGATKAAPPAADGLDDDDEIEELDSMDLVPEDEMPSESTQIGAMPVDPNAFLNHGQPTVPDPLAEQLDAHLADAEAEADELHGELRAASQPAYAEQPAYDPQAYPQAGYEQQAYGEQAGYEQQAHASYAEQPYSEQAHAAQPYNEQAYAAQPHGEPGYGEQPYSEQQAYGEQAYAQQPYGEHQAYGEQPYNEQAYAQQPHGEPGYGEQPYSEQPAYREQPGYAQPGYEAQAAYGEQPYGEPEPQEEVSDLDVLAEADAGDADLLAAHGEQEASGNAQAVPAGEGSFDFATPLPPPGEGSFDYAARPLAADDYAARPPAGEGSFDFAARLDLGDDDAEREFSHEAERGGYARSRHRSYGNGYDDGPPAYSDARRQPSYAEERPGYDNFDSPSSSYTFAESAPVRPTPFEDPDPYGERAPAQLTPIASPPVAQPSVLRDAPAEDYDLENALEALDVDLDELGGVPDRRKPALPGLPTPRTPTGQVPVRTPTGQVPVRTPTGQVPVRSTGGSRTVPPPIPTTDPATERSRGRRTETPARSLSTAKPAKPKRAATEDDGVLIDFDDDD